MQLPISERLTSIQIDWPANRQTDPYTDRQTCAEMAMTDLMITEDAVAVKNVCTLVRVSTDFLDK